jgi:hypothetical protein
MGSADVTGRAIAAPTANLGVPADHKAVVFHNNGLVVALSFIFGLLAIVVGLSAFFLALAPLMHWHHFSFWALYAVLNWGIVAFSMLAVGWSLLKLGSRMVYFRAKLSTEGVEFRLGSRKTPQIQFFAWNQIAQINQKRVPGNHYYSVVGKNNNSAEFTTYTFLRPQKLAQQISQRSHIAITKLSAS